MNHERPRPIYYIYKLDCLSSSPQCAHPIVATVTSGSLSSKDSPRESEVILSTLFPKLPLTRLRFAPSCRVEYLLIRKKAAKAFTFLIYLLWAGQTCVSWHRWLCLCYAERINEWYVNAFLFGRKMQTISGENWFFLWDESSVFPGGASFSELLRSRLLWLYHQRERTRVSG